MITIHYMHVWINIRKKFEHNINWVRIAKTNNSERKIELSDIKAYLKAMIIKAKWYWCENRQINATE